MAKSNNFKKIVNLVNKLYYMDIPSNIRNVEKYMNHIKHIILKKNDENNNGERTF